MQHKLFFNMKNMNIASENIKSLSAWNWENNKLQNYMQLEIKEHQVR